MEVIRYDWHGCYRSEEFHKIYKLEVVVIPRITDGAQDNADKIFKMKRPNSTRWSRKWKNFIRGRPILIGTVSVEKSEYLSEK